METGKTKKQTWDDAKQIRKISDWTKDVIEKMETKNMVIMDEPLAMGIESLDQGLIVRNLNDVPQGTHYYLPGFSALHETTGRDIAKLNGEEDVAKFWRKNYAEPIGKALAEFSAYTGVYYDSPHSQNFMIELDQNKKPTGRIVLRDFGDAYLNRDFISQTAMSSILDIWEADNVIAGRYNTAVGFLHGNKAPTWLSTTEYQSWGKTFYKEYEKHFSEITGIEPATLKLTNITANNHYSYMSKRYQTTGSQWLRYFKYANCLNGAKVTITGEDCPDMFTKFQKTDTCMGIVNSFPH